MIYWLVIVLMLVGVVVISILKFFRYWFGLFEYSWFLVRIEVWVLICFRLCMNEVCILVFMCVSLLVVGLFLRNFCYLLVIVVFILVGLMFFFMFICNWNRLVSMCCLMFIDMLLVSWFW